MLISTLKFKDFLLNLFLILSMYFFNFIEKKGEKLLIGTF